MTSSLVSPALLAQARAMARDAGQDLIMILATLTSVDGRRLVAELGQALQFDVMETTDMLKLSPRFDLLPLNIAQQRNCLLLQQDGIEPLIGVLADPMDADLRIWLDSLTRQPISYRLALSTDIHAFLSKQEESVRAVDNLLAETSLPDTQHKSAERLSFVTVSEAASPAVKLLNSTLYDALKVGASDIHLESTPLGLTVKYRIDGVLDQAAQINGTSLAEQVISRLKVLAELDIAERRVPQDGSFRVEANRRDIDLRVSIMPSIHGEDAVIRILDKQAMIEQHGALTLEALGFNRSELATLRTLAEQPYGMLLVTGPTGSGKTTTLYAALSEINNGRDKIITIEDPVEYQLPGVLQIPVNDKKGLSFARGLRSILRHDPDKIMVGEIRDRETAEIAVQSALTGHLVLTTVHANNVFDVFGRFTHMGLDPYSFASALNGIWAQRLIRLNCPHCSADYVPTAAELKRANLQLDSGHDYRFRRGQGCGDCRGTGYRGRRAIAEILVLDDEMRELIVEKRPVKQLKELARQRGAQNLFEAALALVKQGETTLEEVRRVTLSA